MTSGSSVSSSSGTSILGLLGVVFVVLKLCGVTNWSWWWVTAPFWMPFVVFVAIIVILGVATFCVWLIFELGK